MLLGREALDILRSPTVPYSPFRFARRSGHNVDAVRMDLVTGSAGRAIGYEFGAHAAGLRIERRGIEIGNPIEQTAGADELVERLALGVFLEGTSVPVRRPDPWNWSSVGGAGQRGCEPTVHQPCPRRVPNSRRY